MPDFTPIPRVEASVPNESGKVETRYLVANMKAAKAIGEQFPDRGIQEALQADPFDSLPKLLCVLIADRRDYETPEYFADHVIGFANLQYYTDKIMEAFGVAAAPEQKKRGPGRPRKAEAGSRTGGPSKPSPSSTSDSPETSSGASPIVN